MWFKQMKGFSLRFSFQTLFPNKRALITSVIFIIIIIGSVFICSVDSKIYKSTKRRHELAKYARILGYNVEYGSGKTFTLQTFINTNNNDYNFEEFDDAETNNNNNNNIAHLPKGLPIKLRLFGVFNSYTHLALSYHTNCRYLEEANIKKVVPEGPKNKLGNYHEAKIQVVVPTSSNYHTIYFCLKNYQNNNQYYKAFDDYIGQGWIWQGPDIAIQIEQHFILDFIADMVDIPTGILIEYFHGIDWETILKGIGLILLRCCAYLSGFWMGLWVSIKYIVRKIRQVYTRLRNGAGTGATTPGINTDNSINNNGSDNDNAAGPERIIAVAPASHRYSWRNIVAYFILIINIIIATIHIMRTYFRYASHYN